MYGLCYIQPVGIPGDCFSFLNGPDPRPCICGPDMFLCDLPVVDVIVELVALS